MRDIPESGIFEAPNISVTINEVWLSIIDGLYGEMLEDEFFIGDDDQIAAARQEVYKLLNAIAYAPTIPIQNFFGLAAPSYDALSGATAGNIGFRFTPAVDGEIIGIRHYRVSGTGDGNQARLFDNTGTNISPLYEFPDGELGWTTAPIASPIAVTAGQTYMAAIYCPTGQMTYKVNYFTSALIVGDLTAPADVPAGQRNGVYDTNAYSDFPNTGLAALNWFIDVEFRATP